MKQVKYAKFHQDLFVPGVGGLGTTLPSSSKTLDLTMWHDDQGLLIKVSYGRGKANIMVPWANVVLAQYHDEADLKAVS